MNKFVQMVAILIATFVLFGVSQTAYAQQPAWAGVIPVEVPEWATSDETGNCQSIPGTNQVSCRYFSGAMPADIALLDGAANRPGLQMKRTGQKFFGFPRGTPGTVEMRRFMFCSVSLDCDRPELTIYSHFIKSEKVLNEAGVLVDNPDFAYFRSPEQVRYIVDQGYNGFNVVLPIRTKVAGKVYQFCPTGTREIRKWYNGAFERSQTTPGYKNDGNWRFTNSFAWRDGTLPKGYETSYDDELFCGPAQAEKLWVVNDNPDGAVNDPEQGLTGKYLSVFTINPMQWDQSTRTDVVTVGRSRSVDFDNSRNTTYMPRGTVGTAQAKSLTVSTVANVPDSRLNALVYEPAGEVFHLATSAYGNRVFVYNPKTNQVWNFIAPLGVIPNIDTDADANIQGAIYGDILFRVLSINKHTQTKVEVYDIPTRMQRASYTINKQLTNGGGIFAGRPQISFDPRTNTLWFAALFDGSFGYLELNSGVFTNIPIPVSQESGVVTGATDVEIDTSRNVVYVSIARFRSAWGSAQTPFINGSLMEFDLTTKQIVRQVSVQAFPFSVAMLPTATKTFIAVTNSANQVVNGVNVGSVSIVDVVTFIETARMQTLRSPTALAVDFKD